jgi:uncharacterized membrane protein YuzA (DUF378 family)
MDSQNAAWATYYQKLAFKVAMVFIIVGALNWLLVGAFGINAVELLAGRRSTISRSIYVLVGISALLIAFNRDTYLPFLGETVMPCQVIGTYIPQGATMEVQVEVAPGAKVLYWAAEPENEHLKKLNNWQQAYLKYENAGVTVADDRGVATLKVRPPQAYSVPFKGKLEPHIHFRICGGEGILSRIKTVFVNDGRVEGFRDY